MGIMKSIALAVPVLAVIIGCINSFRPDLWLRVPNIGFIFYAIGGGQVPPFFFFDAWRPEVMRTWVRDGDVVVSSGPKSGTNWLLYTMHQIRTRGTNNPPWVEVSMNTPWMTFKHHPRQTWAELQEKMNTTILPDGTPVKDLWDHPDYPFRVFKAHEMPIPKNGAKPQYPREECLPIEQFKKVKFIAMLRNSKDVLNSFKTFFCTHSDAFKAMWGGFPPCYSTPAECVADFLPDGKLKVLFFGYVTKWWAWRHEENVLLLHYINYKKDPKGTIRRIAEFVDFKLTSAEIDLVAHKTSFEEMKKLTDQFLYLAWVNDTPIRALKGSAEEGMGVFNLGGSGGGKGFLAPELEEKWNKALETEIPDEGMRKWIEEGGEFPN